MSEPLRVLFVCSGNICRSPLAKVIAERVFAEEGIPAEWIDSAGILGIEGSNASAHAIDAAEVQQLDLRNHVSKGLPAKLLEGATHIVAMAPEHAREVRMRRPDLESKIVRIWEHTDRRGRLKEIADPIAQPYKAYMICRDNLFECIRNWAKTLKQTP